MTLNDLSYRVVIIETLFVESGLSGGSNVVCCNIYLILAYTVFDVMNYLMDRVMLVEMS